MTFENYTDIELVKLFNEESTKQKAFKILMHQYKERLYWHIRKIVLAHEDADDALQNTFLKIWQNLDSFQGKSALYTWFYRIATNEALTLLKKKRKSLQISVDDEENYCENSLRSDPYFDGNDIQIQLQKAISILPEKQRIIFNLKYFEELKYDEISEILETSVGSLKASYHHATKKIEAYLKNNLVDKE